MHDEVKLINFKKKYYALVTCDLRKTAPLMAQADYSNQ